MQLTPEQINVFLSNAVLESNIGEAVKESVEKTLKSLTSSYDNPFDKVVKDQVINLIQEQISSTYRPLIEEQVKTSLQKSLTDRIVGEIVQSAIDRMIREHRR